MNKINSYIGFAKRSRAIVFGEDKCLACKNAKLIIYASTLSNNFTSKVVATNIPFCQLEEQIYTGLEINAKVFAITDKNLALAIQKELTIGGNKFDNK